MNYQEHIDRMKQDMKDALHYPTFLDDLTSPLEIGTYNISTLGKQGLTEMLKLLEEDDSRYITYQTETDYDDYSVELLLVMGHQTMPLHEQYEIVLRYWKSVMNINKPCIGDEITEDILKHLEATGYVVKEGK